jgi:hypothetical protein
MLLATLLGRLIRALRDLNPAYLTACSRTE